MVRDYNNIAKLMQEHPLGALWGVAGAVYIARIIGIIPSSVPWTYVLIVLLGGYIGSKIASLMK